MMVKGFFNSEAERCGVKEGKIRENIRIMRSKFTFCLAKLPNPASLRLCVSILLLTIGILGQNDGSQQNKTGRAGTFAIVNARIVPVSGPVIENGTVVIQNGKIAAVGAGAAIPAGAERIDGKGL